MERNPIFIFNNDTDYDIILKFVESTYSNIIINNNYKDSDILKLQNVLNYLYAVNYELSKQDVDLNKYKKFVKASYLSLLCISCIDSNILFTNSFIYYGISDNKTIPNMDLILKSFYINISKQELSYNIPFLNQNIPKYHWIMEPVSEPLKNKWQDTVVSINNGNIGTSLDLFGEAKNLNGYRFYITEYPTQFINPIQIKKV